MRVLLGLGFALGLAAAFRAPLRMSSAGEHNGKARIVGKDALSAGGEGARRQQVKFTIKGPVVEMEVFGAIGDECIKITDHFEEALGNDVIYREDKPERWQKAPVVEENTIFEQKFSEW
uniref:Peptidylprolyl isomerase n=1 Tax=Phaeomonas parva TaxID=124430 RepID=A0A7S1U8I6_9STRA|mmetsp:Transcript_36547/g.114516  ORF Transcript_36547/g.114516 Transcript_36547/m.114516 type:complete len:119 (+) Transcript_36547:105-461(+)|eukprot:CAMPEP_0118879294 /NCGR_PEP_ID=MMETSP1163-20130328/19134_1 /TAXON_ID=124430 /ORGANISM="Phaeomonas parva, Strain CCMP2877" /LENGTH=118 /DNA_ID=CAMNT_0006815413 /DNA_START=44 /DNA_END=397 /DNA_ORIENTATION=-